MPVNVFGVFSGMGFSSFSYFGLENQGESSEANGFNQEEAEPLRNEAESALQPAREDAVDPLPIKVLFFRLKQETEKRLKNLHYASVHGRFFNIPCPEQTAISIGGQYLHANQVGRGISERSFIASQAPLEKEYPIFWQAVLKDCPTIFDLTGEEEVYKEGTMPYYPLELGEVVTYGVVSVALVEVAGCINTYKVKDDQKTALIKRCHYVNWQDYAAVPLDSLETLVREVETLSPDIQETLWIHCRAGVGRTGSLITALILKEKIHLGEITRNNLDKSLIELIVELRKQRGPMFVQSLQQLDLLRRYAYSLLESRESDLVDDMLSEGDSCCKAW